MIDKFDEVSKKNKLKALGAVFKSLSKKTGQENAVQLLGQIAYDNKDRLPSGRIAIDIGAGGGWVRGRICEFYGEEGSGKTLLSLLSIAAVQKMNGVCAFIDVEDHFRRDFAEAQGVNIDELLYSNPESAENALEIMKALIESDSVDLIVLDSVAALTSEKEYEKEAGENTIGIIARLMSSEMKKINKMCAKHKCTVIFINQVRDKVGVMYGNPETTNGGRALKFYASYRLRVSSSVGDKIYTDSSKINCIGQTVKVKFNKNKTAPPFKTAEITVYFDGRSVDEVDEIAEIAIKYNLMPRYDSKGALSDKGRTFKWDSCPEFKASGKADIPKQLKKYPQVLAELKELILSGAINEKMTGDAEEDLDADMSEEAFEESLRNGGSLAEEVEEGDWN